MLDLGIVAKVGVGYIFELIILIISIEIAGTST